jgi:hypothetical protein
MAPSTAAEQGRTRAVRNYRSRLSELECGITAASGRILSCACGGTCAAAMMTVYGPRSAAERMIARVVNIRTKGPALVPGGGKGAKLHQGCGSAWDVAADAQSHDQPVGGSPRRPAPHKDHTQRGDDGSERATVPFPRSAISGVRGGFGSLGRLPGQAVRHRTTYVRFERRFPMPGRRLH